MRATLRAIIFSVPVSLFVCAGLVAQPGGVPDLNSPLIRELRTDDRHLYTVRAAANEALEIVCERKGVDVAMTILALDGIPITASNSPAAFVGFDRSFFVAERPAAYLLEIRSARPGKMVGSYTVSLVRKPGASANDRVRAEAMKLLGETRALMRSSENRFERATQAVETLYRSLELFQESNDLQGQANALFHIATIHANEFGDEFRAAEIYEKALEIWRTIDDEAGKAICLMRAARELSDKGAREKSLAYLDEALAINRKLNDRLGEAATLSLLCRQYNDTGNFQKGFEACREARRLGQDSDPVNDYFMYSALAALYGNTGDLEKALEYNNLTLQRILLTEDLLNPIRLATAKSNIAGILFTQKKYAEGLANYQEALLVSQKVRRPKYEAYFLAQISSVLYETREYTKALETGERSLVLYRQHYPRNRQVILRIIGNVHVALGQNDKARTTLLESLEMNRQNRDRYAEAETLYNLAQLEFRIGDPETALRNMREAINISELLRADLLGKNQRTSYLTILKRYYEFDIELLVTLYEKKSAIKYLEQAWQDQEKLRARSLLENFLESGLESGNAALTPFLKRERDLREAISTSELKRSEALRAGNALVATALEKDLQARLDEYGVLHEEIRKSNPRFSALGLPKELSFADVQGLLGDDTAVVEYSLGERQSYAWIITRNSIKLAKLPGRGAIGIAAREFYVGLADHPAKDRTVIIERSKRLSRAVLQPFAAEIAGFRRVVIIADGSLQIVPFSALPLSTDGAYEPLAAKMEIVNAPSFSSLVLLLESRNNRQTKPDRSLAVFADPIFQYDDERLGNVRPTPASDRTADPTKLTQALSDFGVQQLARLPFSGIEAREIAKFDSKPVLTMGANASRQNFLRGDYSSFRILHFATHGFINQQNPDLSGLVFSLFDENGRPQNGFLRVIDVYSLRLSADIVVLSACQTALGKDVEGEGIVGLTRGFMYAGSSSVVSSLWKVEDAATAELMKRFYRAMLKENQTPPAALRVAQNELRQIPRFSHPRHWAGFTFTGAGQ